MSVSDSVSPTDRPAARSAAKQISGRDARPTDPPAPDSGLTCCFVSTTQFMCHRFKRCCTSLNSPIVEFCRIDEINAHSYRATAPATHRSGATKLGKQRAFNVGAIRVVITAMRNHPADPNVQEQGSWALRDMCTGTDAAVIRRVAAAVSAGARDVIGAALSAHPRNVRVRHYGQHMLDVVLEIHGRCESRRACTLMGSVITASSLHAAKARSVGLIKMRNWMPPKDEESSFCLNRNLMCEPTMVTCSAPSAKRNISSLSTSSIVSSRSRGHTQRKAALLKISPRKKLGAARIGQTNLDDRVERADDAPARLPIDVLV